MGKLFSFYILIFSYKPSPDHHTVVISTKSLFIVENKIETVVSDHRKSGLNLGLVAYENELLELS